MSEEAEAVDTPEKKLRRNILILTTILMGLIAVATAWSGYQGSNWGSENSANTSLANTARSESIRASLTANQLTMLDIQLFIEWLNATAQERPILADYYQARMRDEAKPAFDAWLAQDQINNPDAPSSPFVMAEYKVQQRVEADQLENEALDFANKAADASDVSGQYVLSTVILASALFFAGISTRVVSIKIEMVFTAMSLLLFAFGVYRLVILWVQNAG
jgi:hypothetical protein